MKLKNEIASILTLKSLMFVSVFSMIFYFYVKDGFVNQVKNQLSSVAEHKKTVVKSYFEHRLGEFKTLVSLPVITENLYKYSSSGNKNNLTPIRQTIAEYAASIPYIKNVHVLDTSRIIIASSDSALIGKAFANQRIKISGNSSSKSYFIQHYDTLIFQISAPIEHNNAYTGCLLMEYYADEIKELSTDYFGLGQTGETIIAVSSEEGEYIYLLPPRFNSHKQFLKVDKDQDIATVMAMQGKEAFYEEIQDYRGEDVIAVTNYLESPGWGMVTKLDREEGLSTVLFIRDLTIWLAIIFSIILIIASFILADYLVKPIKKITSAAVRISKGDLSKKVNFSSKNELGILAESFNTMTDKLTAAREDLEHKIEELNRSNESLNRFAYIVSHDLKSPLASITALSDLINDEYKEKLDDQGQMMFGMLQTKVSHMQQLIDGILHYSRMGNCTGKDEDTDLNEVVNEVFEDLAGKKKINFIKEDNLPVLYINRICIKQVFQNLVSNSVKYMDKEDGTVKVSYNTNDRYHILSVSDNGPGIHPKYHDKIFEIFNTGAISDSTESTGVGLAIVKRIVETYKGCVKLDSNPGEGTTFNILIPLR